MNGETWSAKDWMAEEEQKGIEEGTYSKRLSADELVKKTAADPGAPFEPEALELLAALKKEDHAKYEALRAKLKKAKCRVGELDDAVAKEGGEKRGRAQADILIEIALAADLFHTPDGTAFADLEINGHRETWPLRAKGFRRWLSRRFFEEHGGAPNSDALQSALNVIEAKAAFDSPERTVHLRVAGIDNRLYLDLCNAAWQAVEIDADGWRIIDKPPVRFRRTAGMKPLPAPAPGGSVRDLRPFLNVQSNEDFVLVVAWVLACLRNSGPYPAMALAGEQGSAKSTFSAVLRALIDPNTAPLRALPREDRDLFIAATNGHLLAFDNVSGLPDWISDTLCRLATGGGFAVRALYSDQDEILFNEVRPIILNGIEDIVGRPDLADRAVFLTLESIPEDKRRPEGEFWAAFEDARPGILGALLDAVAKGLANLPQTRLDKLPRMADFALWATACETAIWPPGTFMRAYNGNRDEAVENVIDADPVATAILGLARRAPEWEGTATELLSALIEIAGERASKDRKWPTAANKLTGRLRRAATFLRKVGVEIYHERDGKRTVRIIYSPRQFEVGNLSSVSSVSSIDSEINWLDTDDRLTIKKSIVSPGQSIVSPVRVTDDTDDTADDHPNRSSVHNSLKTNNFDGPDDTDDKIPTHSETKKGNGWRARL